MHTPDDKTTSERLIRVALVGCGEVCEHKHLPALRRVSGSRVVALVDTDPRRLAHVSDRFGIPGRFPDILALIDARVADVIGILVPPSIHVDLAATALAADYDVLIEKPLALTLADADAIADAARRASGRMLMGFHMRLHRLIQRARQAIRQGAIGTPESIRAIWNSPRSDLGIPPWKCRRATGGGALVELGVHIFDLWRFLLDTEVTEVFARSRHGRRDDENAVVTATLSNGTLASALISERTGHEIEIEISGDRGRLRIACQRFDGFELYGVGETRGMIGPRLRGAVTTAREMPRGLARMRHLGDYGDSYRGEWQHLIDAIHATRAPECTVEDGRAALRVVHAATASASRGEPIRIAEAPTILTPVDSPA